MLQQIQLYNLIAEDRVTYENILALSDKLTNIPDDSDINDHSLPISVIIIELIKRGYDLGGLPARKVVGQYLLEFLYRDSKHFGSFLYALEQLSKKEADLDLLSFCSTFMFDAARELKHTSEMDSLKLSYFRGSVKKIRDNIHDSRVGTRKQNKITQELEGIVDILSKES